MVCYPWETEPSCLVTHIAFVNFVGSSKTGQGISALKNSIMLKYHFDMHHIPYEAKSVKHREVYMHVM